MRITFAILSLFFVSVCNAQIEIMEKWLRESEDRITGCELDLATLDAVYNVSEGKRLIIAVARLGYGETDENLSKKRLERITLYFKGSWNVNPKLLIMTRGNRVKSNGRVEFYVRGFLAGLIIAKKNDSLRIQNCVTDDLDIPLNQLDDDKP